MNKKYIGGLFAYASLSILACGARGEVEHFFTGVGADTQLVFPHAHVTGATGIDFSINAAVDGGPRLGSDPPFPVPVSHDLVTVFEWGPTATGPWSTSPDNVKSFPVEETSFFFTSVFHGPEETPFVAIHFYAGNLMTVNSGSPGGYTHVSVPEPASLGLLGGALGLLMGRRGKR